MKTNIQRNGNIARSFTINLQVRSCAALSLMLLAGGIDTANAQEHLMTQVPTAPLAQNDPRAQLEANLRNVPVIPMPHAFVKGDKPVKAKITNNLIGFNPQTGAVSLQKLNPEMDTPSNLLHDAGAPGFQGTSEGIEEETHAANNRRRESPGDPRVRITPTTSFPWRTNCKLYMSFPNGKSFQGSATLIAAKYVITAGHCAYSAENGGWATNIQVIPALDNTYKPYGTYKAVYYRSDTGWTQNSDWDHDFALLTLNAPVGNTTGWLGYAYLSNLDGDTGNVACYPGEKQPGPGLGMWYSYGPISHAGSWPFTDDQQFDITSLSVTPGSSGGGIYVIYPGSNRYVLGVVSHSWSAWYGSGIRATKIDSQKFNWIKSWIATGF